MIQLKTKTSEAGLVTDGACLTHFRHEGRDILRPNKPFKNNPLNAACFPCTPYFGRIPNGVSLDSKENIKTSRWPLFQTHQEIDTPIHGEAWISPWQIHDENPEQVTLTQSSPGQIKGAYPFAWHATKTITLDCQCLSVELTLKNTHTHVAPFGLGLHPFFPRFSDTRLQFDFATLHTPPEFSPISLDQHPFSKGSNLPDFTIDHSFIRWSGCVHITGNHAPAITLKSNAPYLHLYAPQGEDFFCLEPITQLPGAFSNPTSISGLMLAPHQTRTVKMEIKASGNQAAPGFKKTAP